MCNHWQLVNMERTLVGRAYVVLPVAVTHSMGHYRAGCSASLRGFFFIYFFLCKKEIRPFIRVYSQKYKSFDSS